MASTSLIIMGLSLLMLSSSQFCFSQIPSIPNSISAAPALLPTIPPPPLSSPSPDITPLFPSPAGTDLSPTESTLPTIPSSPSPPNPDDMPTYGPNTMAISPTASLPASSSVSGIPMVVTVCLVVFQSLFMFLSLQWWW